MQTRRAVLAGLSATGAIKATGASAHHSDCHKIEPITVGDWTVGGRVNDQGPKGYIVDARAYHQPSRFSFGFPVFDTNKDWEDWEFSISGNFADANIGSFTIDTVIADYLRTEENPPIDGAIVFRNTSSGASVRLGARLFAIRGDDPETVFNDARYSPVVDTYSDEQDVRDIANMLFSASSSGDEIILEFYAYPPSGERVTDRFRLNGRDFNNAMDTPYFVMEGSVFPEVANCEDLPDDCFLTTACCDMLGRPDDGFELRTLRYFRDNWLKKQPTGAVDVALYYELAPKVCQAIADDPKGQRRLWWVYLYGILPSIAAVKLGANRMAYKIYKNRMERLGRLYNIA